MYTLRILLKKSVEGGVSLLTVVMVAVVFLQVTNRYVFNNPLSWTEEVARFIFVWITFMGALLALKTKAHIGVNSFMVRFSSETRAMVENMTIFFIIFYLFYLIIFGIKIVQETAQTFTPALNISFSYIYVAIPLSAILMISYLVAQLFHSKWKTIALSGIITMAILVTLHLLFGGGRGSGGNLILLAIICLGTLILINTPIAFSIGLSSLLFLILQQRTPLLIIPNRMVGGIDSFPLLAVPFFILAGEFMNTGGITQRLVNLAKVLVGHIRGGLGMVVVVGEYFFSGISGSTVADVSAIGSLLIPAMKKAGYKSEHAVAIVSSASAMGILVPPCITMVVLGGMTGLSIGVLFMAGFIPAVVLAICILALIYIQAVGANLPVEKLQPMKEALKSIAEGIIPLMLPIIIFGGILSGAATPTEVSVIAVVYGFLVGTFVYKEIKFNQVIPILTRTATLTGTVMFLVGTSSVLSWIFATNQVPQKLGAIISYFSSSPWVFLLFSNIIFILLGAALEGLPALIILIPVFFPLINQFGINPIHYGILVVASLGIGVFIPPVGMGIFIACSFAEIDIGRAAGAFMPFLLALFIGLLFISYIPWFTLALPNIFFPMR
jgi:tripartite ATP-independent transporter DctM subunit